MRLDDTSVLFHLPLFLTAAAMLLDNGTVRQRPPA